MNLLLSLGILALGSSLIEAAPVFHADVLGQSLGGWDAKQGRAADYEISGTTYRTWLPHITPMVDGGIFVSVRIDHLRGVFASNDHASLELAFDRNGEILSAQSSIALQGRKITSDLVQSSAKLGTSVVGLERVASVGTDMVGSLTAKMLREKVTEPGRVGFPAAVRHNYNLLCLAVGNEENRAIPLEGAMPAIPVDPDELTRPEGEPPATEEPAAEEAPPTTVPSDPSPSPETKVIPPLKINEQGKEPKKERVPLPLPDRG